MQEGEIGTYGQIIVDYDFSLCYDNCVGAVGRTAHLF